MKTLTAQISSEFFFGQNLWVLMCIFFKKFIFIANFLQYSKNNETFTNFVKMF